MKKIIEIKKCEDCPFYNDVDMDAIDRGEKAFCNYYEFHIWPTDIFENDNDRKSWGYLEDGWWSEDEDEEEAYREFYENLEKPLFCNIKEIIIKEEK